MGRLDAIKRYDRDFTPFILQCRTYRSPALSVLLDALSLFGPKPARPGHVRGKEGLPRCAAEGDGDIPKMAKYGATNFGCNLYKTKLNHQVQAANSLLASLKTGISAHQRQIVYLLLPAIICLSTCVKNKHDSFRLYPEPPRAGQHHRLSQRR